jgi:hypothetical protein
MKSRSKRRGRLAQKTRRNISNKFLNDKDETHKWTTKDWLRMQTNDLSQILSF